MQAWSGRTIAVLCILNLQTLWWKTEVPQWTSKKQYVFDYTTYIKIHETFPRYIRLKTPVAKFVSYLATIDDIQH